LLLRQLQLTDCLSCSEAGSSPDWFSGVELSTLTEMLTTVLYQCVECLADPMWELRRMAAQVVSDLF